MRKAIPNKLTGNRFETELCETLAKHGFWAHNMAQNDAGQPADIIAVRDNIAILVDCKDCRNNRFPLSRIEGNQESAMRRFYSCGNDYCFFALKMASGDIFMVPAEDLFIREEKGYGDLGERECVDWYQTLNEWISDFCLEDYLDDD